MVDRFPVPIAQWLEVTDPAVAVRHRNGDRRTRDELLQSRANAPVVGRELLRSERALLTVSQEHVNPLRLPPLE